MLKSIAYHTIKATLEGKKYEPGKLSDVLLTKCGAFVSLHKREDSEVASDILVKTCHYIR